MKIIDCDVHHFGPTQEEWLAHLEVLTGLN